MKILLESAKLIPGWRDGKDDIMGRSQSALCRAGFIIKYISSVETDMISFSKNLLKYSLMV